MPAPPSELLAALTLRAEISRRCWTTDRWGRLISGASVIAFVLPEVCTAWTPLLLCALAAGAASAGSALAGWCPFHELLKWLGAKDREEVFAEGLRACAGLAREQAPAQKASPRILEAKPIHEREEAAEYRAMIHRHAWLLNRPFLDAIGADCGGRARARVIDLGTGPGWIPVQLALRHPGWECWGIDASESMLAMGRAYAQARGVADRVHFVRADATAVPFEDGAFDLVVSNFVLHHLPEPARLLDEAARLARPGGRVMIKDLRRVSRPMAWLQLAFSRWVLRYTPAQLAMYADSLAAALTPAEAREAAERSRLQHAQIRGMRGLDFVIASGCGRPEKETEPRWAPFRAASFGR
ncbi:MAG: methyltransferase domain-containing protein [Planctomycetota bacterium]|nr:methyltransferase domain-containing protein [Planctomycetota bacterium]